MLIENQNSFAQTNHQGMAFMADALMCHTIATSIRQTSCKPFTAEESSLIQDREWRRDEILIDAANSLPTFQVLVATFPELAKRARQLGVFSKE